MYQLYGYRERPPTPSVELWKRGLHPEDYPSAWEACQATLRGEAPFDTVFRVRLPEGGVRHLQAHGVVLRDATGRPTRMLGVNYDISARVQAEAALRQATQEAQAANRAKSLFLSTMSHEIRTPLNGVIGMADLLLQAGLTPHQTEMAKTIQDCGRGLLAVIGDVLDLARIESGHLQLETVDFDLRQVAAGLQGMFAPALQAKGLAFELRIDPALPPRLRGDVARLRQVLINLLGNAVKFTERGRVGLGFALLPSDPDRARVACEVEDSGPGIPAHYLPRLFQPFTQADAGTTRSHGGSGLGLAIAKRLAELLGGDISVGPGPQGLGTRFRLVLPFQVGTVSAAPAPRPGGVAWRRPPRVLMVEDDPVGQATLRLMLQSFGCHCRLATDGLQAIAVAQEEAFDLVLMDCQMPLCDGFTATHRIREACPAGAPRLPIIALTANAFTEDRDRCLAAGMDDYLAKPCTLEELRACILRWTRDLQ